MKTGIYGGTFSPLHNGHVIAAREFVRQFDLDRVLIIPTAMPPHKTEKMHVDAGYRLEMCRLAFRNDDKFVISDIEIRRGGKSYTSDTLEELKTMFPQDEFFLLCGTDMFLSFDTWHRFQDIFGMCTVVYVRRENERSLDSKICGKTAEYRELYDADIRHINIAPIQISSTELRDRLMHGEDVSGFIPPPVLNYIKTNGLYTSEKVGEQIDK